MFCSRSTIIHKLLIFITNAKGNTCEKGVKNNANISNANIIFDNSVCIYLDGEFVEALGELLPTDIRPWWDECEVMTILFHKFIDNGISFNTDLSESSRRGYATASMNTNELLWNAQASYSFLTKVKLLRATLQHCNIATNKGMAYSATPSFI